MPKRSARLALIPLLTAMFVVTAACASDGDGGATAPATEAAPHAAPQLPGADLAPVKSYLLRHTEQLESFTADFERAATRYQEFAERGVPVCRPVRDPRPRRGRRALRGEAGVDRREPAYERMEGIVAGTPSLSRYDVILDAGSSAAEDPAGAVPFDLELADGRTLEQPGNLFSLTEGMLWGQLVACRSRTARGLRHLRARSRAAPARPGARSLP
jgi:hypothetical protein